MNKIFIIGGGASGLMSAIYASKNKNNQVTILEKNNDCAKKILVTGNGKCNYFNENQSLNKYHSRNEELINNLINDENLQLVKDTFTYLGISPKIKNGYYYPSSSQAITIKNVLLKSLEKPNVNIINNVEVTNIKKEKDSFKIFTKNKTYIADKVILSTGSRAFPKTGSDGKGYEILKNLNHSIIDVLPSLVQLKIKENYTKDWAGIRTDVSLKLFENDRFIKEEQGEIQLTNYGVSGICIMNLSSYVAIGLHEHKKETIKINFVPFIENNLLSYLQQLNQMDKTIEDLLNGILNNKLVKVILNKIKLNPNKKFNKLTNEEQKNVEKVLKSFEIKIIDTNSYNECQVCSGGIPLTEINLKTMESKKIKNLYITGELIDINGDCGGYNLTNAWITGILAGRSA